MTMPLGLGHVGTARRPCNASDLLLRGFGDGEDGTFEERRSVFHDGSIATMMSSAAAIERTS